MDQAICPECDELVPLTAPIKLGQRVRCPSCEARLIAIRLDPLELDWAFIEPFEAPHSSNGKNMADDISG